MQLTLIRPLYIPFYPNSNSRIREFVDTVSRPNPDEQDEEVHWTYE